MKLSFPLTLVLFRSLTVLVFDILLPIRVHAFAHPECRQVLSSSAQGLLHRVFHLVPPPHPFLT